MPWSPGVSYDPIGQSKVPEVPLGPARIPPDRDHHGELDPSSEVFRRVFGGYGGLGVVTEAELDLEPNSRLRRVVEDVDLATYPTRFHDLSQDPRVVLHNADLRPPDFDAPRMISWHSTTSPVTVQERLIPRDRNYARNQAAIWAVSELPGGARLRKAVEERLLKEELVLDDGGVELRKKDRPLLRLSVLSRRHPTVHHEQRPPTPKTGDNSGDPSGRPRQ